jgi:O-antigen/teichoic acid export membrane protein
VRATLHAILLGLVMLGVLSTLAGAVGLRDSVVWPIWQTVCLCAIVLALWVTWRIWVAERAASERRGPRA